eukprot:3219231-Pleurochrysis_carterae.AAC.1
MYADSRGPSAILPPSAVAFASPGGAASRGARPAGSALWAVTARSASSSATFMRGGYAAAAASRALPASSLPCATCWC